MAGCPICGTASAKQVDRSPYFSCPGCGLWYQSPLPPKKLHGAHETWVGQRMGDEEKAANKGLADWLFSEVLHDKPGPTLDVGASYAWLAQCLAMRGCDAIAWDPSGELKTFAKDYPLVARRYADFEDMNAPNYRGLRLITFVHSFEHLYDPIAAFRKAWRMLRKDGALFIRMSDNGVEGYERDMTEGHYTIHPYFHAISSIAELCAQTRAFVIERATELRPGQRDIVLRPISV